MIGEVVDNRDPEKQGRVRLRVFGFNDERDRSGNYVTPTDALLWAKNGNGIFGGSPSGAGSFSVPKVGSMVHCEGDRYNLTYYENLHISKELIEDIGDAYVSAHVLLHDTDLGGGDGSREGEHIKVYFTDDEGFVIDYATPAGSNKIKMSPDNAISIENASGVKISIEGTDITVTGVGTLDLQADEIKLGKNSSKHLLTVEKFQEMFNGHTHPTTAQGSPTAPPAVPMMGDGRTDNITC